MKRILLFIAASYGLDCLTQRLMPVLDVEDYYPFHPVDGVVHALADWQGQLVVGGNFSAFFGQEIQNIFLWNGSHAVALGEGFDSGASSDKVNFILPVGNELFVAGRYDSEFRVLNWDGTSWSALGEPFDGLIYELEWHDTTLFAAGKFSEKLKRWNGGNWVEVDNGFETSIKDLQSHDGYLYAAGDDLLFGNETYDMWAARWNGNNWSLIQTLADSSAILRFAKDGNQLYGCGQFYFEDSPAKGFCEINGLIADVAEIEAPEYIWSAVALNDKWYFTAVHKNHLGEYVGDAIYEGKTKLEKFHLENIDNQSQTPPVPLCISANKIFCSANSFVSFVYKDLETHDINSVLSLEPGRTTELLDTNNVSAFFNTTANQFWDFEEELPRYFVPKADTLLSIERMHLWASGLRNGEMMAATSMYDGYQEGWSFGPVCNYVDVNYAHRYYNVWKVNGEQILEHINNYSNQDYVIPNAILTWPGNGNFDNGEAHMLAPFTDVDGDNLYEPLMGDAPSISGDEAIFFILNDQRAVHIEFGDIFQFPHMNLELHGMAYSFDDENDAINNSVFFHCTVFNRSENDYEDFKFGVMNVWELGYPYDNFIGCDSIMGTFYTYNGDEVDNSSLGYLGYEVNPPAQGCTFLNRQISAHLKLMDAGGVCNSDPITPSDFFYEMRGLDHCGEPVEYNSEFPAGSCTFSDPPCGPAGDNCIGQGFSPSVFRSIGSTESIELAAGEYACYHFVLTYNRDTLLDNFGNACSLVDVIPEVVDFWEQLNVGCDVNTGISNQPDPGFEEMIVWPNPTGTILNFTPTKSNEPIQFKVFSSNGLLEKKEVLVKIKFWLMICYTVFTSFSFQLPITRL